MKSLLKFLRSIIESWHPYSEQPISNYEIIKAMKAAAIPAYSYYFMLAAAASIATFGLLANSAPAIIGAMIIAPLMTPIMSLAFGLISLDLRMMAESLISVASGVILVVAISFASAELIGLRIAGSEVLSRTAPTLLDLGVALAAGAAAAFVHTRKSITNSIAGVAIAVALVPPLAVVGVGLALGRSATAEVGLSLTELGHYSGGTDIAAGAFILFLTNLIGIVTIGGIVFMCHGYGSWKKALATMAALLGLAVFLIKPLNHALYELYIKSTAIRVLTTLVSHRPDLFTRAAKFEALNVTYRDGLVLVDIDAFVPNTHIQSMQDQTNTFQQYMAATLKQPVVVSIDVIPVKMLNFRALPMTNPEEIEKEIMEDLKQ